MYYARVQGTNKFMRKGSLHFLTQNLVNARPFKTIDDCQKHIDMYKGSLGTLERPYKFEIVDEGAVNRGIANTN